MTKTLVYCYKRGLGWLATTNPDFLVDSYAAPDASGRVITILDREPRLGERGWYTAPHKTLEQIWREVTEAGPDLDNEYAWEANESDCAPRKMRDIVTVWCD